MAKDKIILGLKPMNTTTDEFKALRDLVLTKGYDILKDAGRIKVEQGFATTEFIFKDGKYFASVMFEDVDEVNHELIGVFKVHGFKVEEY